MAANPLPIHLMTRADFNAYRKERAKEATQAKFEHGGHAGRTPLGYQLRYGPFGNAGIVADEETAPLVREAFRLMATDGYPVRRLAAAMGEKGLRSSQGKPVSPQALWFVLTNPFYMGEVRYRGRTSAGLHEALVDAETFEAVQRSLNGRARNQQEKKKASAVPPE